MNNLVAPCLVAVALLHVTVSANGAPRLSAVAMLSAFVALGAGPLDQPDSRVFETARGDHRAAVSFVRGELEAGRNPLVHWGTTTWIEAGGPGVPRDQVASAVELYLARDPAFDRHVARLASGVYGSIVTPSATFVAESADRRPFGQEMRRAVSGRYCLVYPTGSDGLAVSLTSSGDRLFILRRRDLGCSPLVSASDAR